MKFGMLARSEDRGLGNLTWEWWRAMKPSRTLLVIPDVVQKAGLVSHVERYPDAMLMPYDGKFDEQIARVFLDGLDVVYSAETYYDWQFCEWAREMGVATVCHAMPEFMRGEWAKLPTQWWAPTTYRLQHLPPGTRVVPVPIPADRWPHEPSAVNRDAPLRWLHVAGAQTIQDRNGTRGLWLATNHMHQEHDITIRTQTPLDFGSAYNSIGWHMDERNLVDYWDLYNEFDAMVMPRRYAGLCLPVLEAFGAGLPVIMTDTAPQCTDWPCALTEVHPAAPVQLAGGQIPTVHVTPQPLGELMDSWAKDRDLVEKVIERQQRYVATHCWDAMRGRVGHELAKACA